MINPLFILGVVLCIVGGGGGLACFITGIVMAVGNWGYPIPLIFAGFFGGSIVFTVGYLVADISPTQGKFVLIEKDGKRQPNAGATSLIYAIEVT